MPVQRLKEKILELTGLLCAETGIFQKLVIIYKYIRLLNTDPLAKNILQGIFDETTATMGEMCKGVTDEKVLINIQDKITNAHKILKYIFIDNKKNLEDDFFYSEIAEDEFQDTEYKSNQKAWETYHIACRYINKKVMEQTNNKITDFLIYNTGKTGKVKLNKIYL